MGLNSTPSGERVHIGFFGRRNAGKSSIVNAVTGQELAVVSDTKGTTTDPVLKSMELLPLGPVMIIDTPGFDDVGELGELRVRKTKQILNKTDIAVLIVDSEKGIQQCENELISLFREKNLAYIIAYNKSDIIDHAPLNDNEISVSAKTKKGIFELKEMIARSVSTDTQSLPIVGDLIKPGETVILVVPVDSAAPKGRLILPQQQTIREILDANALALVVKETELKNALSGLSQKPSMVITDSQAFRQVSAETPDDVTLTSFSILMARHKGYLDFAVPGAAAIKHLKDGDRILISEGCTHHRQCDDIGTVKLPRWLKSFTGKELIFETSSGTEFPDDLEKYALIIHCGGCMLNEREVKYRMKCAADKGVPMTNYGVAIALMNGILSRSLSLFPDLQKKL